MSTFKLVTLAFTLAGCMTSPTLVVMADGGEFVETERTAEHSIVEVRKTPQGSVPASIYVGRGVCAVMRSRGESYVDSTLVSKGPFTYRLTFPKSPDAATRSGPSRSVIGHSECGMLEFVRQSQPHKLQ